MKYVIGIDVGTSSVKSILLSSEGQIIDTVTASYSPDFGDKGHVEQEPSVWWANAKTVIKQLMEQNAEAAEDVVALSCSGQMHSSVFLDKAGHVVRPAILWNDTRTTEQTKTIYKRAGGEENLLSAVYNRALEGFTLPKILWLLENEPDNFKKVDKVIMPKDYINYMLTGRIATDYSDAAGTLMFDVKKRAFNLELLNAVGIPGSLVPEAMESTGTVGVCKHEIAIELGLPKDMLVIAGGADNSCAAIGNGVCREGQAVISVGTSGTVVAFLQDIQAMVTGDVHLFNYSYPKSMYAMGCMLSAGESLNWLKRNILTDLSFEDMNTLAEETPVGSNKLIFLPYLFGERCPYSDANARGVFFGLSGITQKGDMARAVMEGVAFGLKDMFNLVLNFAPMDEIYITGGGAKSRIWGQIISDVLNRNLSVLNIEEGPAFGAALIASVGAGVFSGFEEAKEKALKVVKTICPKENAKYEPYYQVFRSLYAANKNLFAELKDLS